MTKETIDNFQQIFKYVMLQKPLDLSRIQVACCCFQIKVWTLTQACLSLQPLGPLYLSYIGCSNFHGGWPQLPLPSPILCLFLLSSWKLTLSRLLWFPPLALHFLSTCILGLDNTDCHALVSSLFGIIWPWLPQGWSPAWRWRWDMALVSQDEVRARGEGSWKELRGGGGNPFHSPLWP